MIYWCKWQKPTHIIRPLLTDGAQNHHQVCTITIRCASLAMPGCQCTPCTCQVRWKRLCCGLVSSSKGSCRPHSHTHISTRPPTHTHTHTHAHAHTYTHTHILIALPSTTHSTHLPEYSDEGSNVIDYKTGDSLLTCNSETA